MHRVMCDSPYQAAALLPDTESLPPGGIGGRLSKGHIDYDPFAATLDCLTQAMQARSVCTVSYRAALHRQEKTWQYAPLRLLAYRESLFVQGHMVTDDGPVERLFDDTTLLALHRITASRVTGRSSATLPAIPAPSGEGLGIREMEEEPFEVSVRFAPEAATYAAERRWSRDQRCEMHDDGSVTLPIKAHNEAECLSRVLGFADRAQVWPRTGCAGRSRKRSLPWPAWTTRRTNRQTRPKAAARLPRPAPCGCGSNPRCRPVCIPTGCSSIRYFVLAHPVRIHAGSSRSVLYFAPAPEGLLGYPCSALP